MTEQLDQWLADQIADCDVDVRWVKSEWSDLCQHEVVTFADANLSPACLPALAELSLTFSSEFVFATDDLQSAFQKAVWDSPRMLELRGIYETESRQHLERLGLSAFPKFDPAHETLRAFAERVEAECGFPNGQMLTVDNNDRILLTPAHPQDLTPADVSKLMALLNHAAPGVVFTVMAQDSCL